MYAPLFTLDNKELRTWLETTPLHDVAAWTAYIVRRVELDKISNYYDAAQDFYADSWYEWNDYESGKLIAKLLPSGLREPVIAAPKEMQMNVLCAIMPIAAAYADQVEVMYADEKKQYLGLMSIIVARQAGGKSGCKEAVECWMKILKDESDAYRSSVSRWKKFNLIEEVRVGTNKKFRKKIA